MPPETDWIVIVSHRWKVDTAWTWLERASLHLPHTEPPPGDTHCSLIYAAPEPLHQVFRVLIHVRFCLAEAKDVDQKD